MTMEAPPVEVRPVWQSNLAVEFNLIQQSLHQFPYVSIDIEFPGTIYNPTHIPSLSPSQIYFIMKQNVDALNLIQLGLTLSDSNGNLPQFGTESQYVWEFNFCDFDSDRDLHNPESISLLKCQGIDFLMNKHNGISSDSFTLMFKACGLGLGSVMRRKLTWITFHGMYDLGFLIKILTKRQLPDNLKDFMTLVKLYFGLEVYDLKSMGRVFGVHGGLDRVAKSLNLDRVVGRRHQAGSDSLLTMQVFMELAKSNCFNAQIMEEFSHKLYGLTIFS